MTQADLTCKELVELVTDYLEDAMPPGEKDRFEAHLRGCTGCQRYVEQMRQTIALTGQLTEQDVPRPAQEKLLDAFRHWKQGGN